MTTFRIIKPIGLTRLVIKFGKVVSVKRSASGRGHDGGSACGLEGRQECRTVGWREAGTELGGPRPQVP